MAKKKFNLNIKVAYDAPVTLSFVIICAIIFLLNMFLAKSGKAGGLEKVFASPTNQAGVLPFIPSAPVSYVRLLFYIFGAGGEVPLHTRILHSGQQLPLQPLNPPYQRVQPHINRKP